MLRVPPKVGDDLEPEIRHLRYLSHGKPRKESKRLGIFTIFLLGGYHDSNTMAKNV